MAKQTAEFDIIVYGASGFTGRLVAEYLAARGITRWAMGGRSLTKLTEVRDEMGLPAETPLVVANSDDLASLELMCARTRVIITTVGPYQLYGPQLVAACAKTGTDYVDLCGEPAWMREMIDAHDDTAKASGARIVFSCGFDSIPFDLGVWFLQQEAIKTHGKPAPRVKGRVRKMQGGASGGTIASLTETMKAAAKNGKTTRSKRWSRLWPKKPSSSWITMTMTTASLASMPVSAASARAPETLLTANQPTVAMIALRPAGRMLPR
jgi:short subunit dehydrogenase-like uncharacterized protein